MKSNDYFLLDVHSNNGIISSLSSIPLLVKEYSTLGIFFGSQPFEIIQDRFLVCS